MSKLSEPLKALINARFALPDVTPAPKSIHSVFERIARDAASKDVGVPAWLTIATATSMTLNSPASLTTLYNLAAAGHDEAHGIRTAELMREVGLKCISFNGIPRVINNLGAFRASLPPAVVRGLSTQPTREPTSQNIDDTKARGVGLWTSIYRPFDRKLLDKLAASHPDLPVHIVNSHYAALLSDPPLPPGENARPRVGRVLTPLVAISCLRAQTGVGPQVVSHVFGLRKAFEDERGQATKEEPEAVQGGRWLASDEGNLWILGTVDAILKAFEDEVGARTTFAPGLRSKL
ncbi:uncharacterized protein IWZ02DRAFT_418175 [Phyllosticta citriasiana]|uniref:uncharacterized protein n=1 Tax=Phyllosticta citriasiana TaxID=595635 RepID=UPI0030FD9A9E